MPPLSDPPGPGFERFGWHEKDMSFLPGKTLQCFFHRKMLVIHAPSNEITFVTVCLFVCLFVSYSCPCPAYVGYVGTGRCLLTGHHTLLFRQTARDPLHVLTHRYDNTWHVPCWTSLQHWLEQGSDTELESTISTWKGPCVIVVN